jgi:hypothetical protein
MSSGVGGARKSEARLNEETGDDGGDGGGEGIYLGTGFR